MSVSVNHPRQRTAKQQLMEAEPEPYIIQGMKNLFAFFVLSVIKKV